MRSTTIIFAAVAAFVQFAAATPPACLIAAVGLQSNPADVKVLCGTDKDLVIGNITESCSDDTERTALTTFKSTCDGAGYTITLPSATATSTSASKTSTGSSKTSSATSASDENEDVSDVLGDSANGTTTEKGSVAAGNGTEEAAPKSGAGSTLSTGSSIFLGSMIAVAGLASQLL